MGNFVISIWFLYSAICVVYPLKPFKKRRHAVLSLVAAFVVILIIAPSPQEKVANEYTKEQKLKTSIVESKLEISSNAVITNDEEDNSQISSEGRPMSFSACSSMIQDMRNQVEPYYRTTAIVNTDILKIYRFHLNDGSVLVTCSKPDGKMIVTKSPHHPN